MSLTNADKYTSVDSDEVFFLKDSLSDAEKLTQVLRFLNYMGGEDALVKYCDSLMIFSKSIFSHLSGDGLSACVSSFLNNVKTSSLKMKDRKPIKTIKMVDNSPTVADLIKNG